MAFMKLTFKVPEKNHLFYKCCFPKSQFQGLWLAGQLFLHQPLIPGTKRFCLDLKHYSLGTV